MKEERRAYHHGNLRSEMIETGIEMIAQVGEEGVSFRQLAKSCGVSSAAPYAHFQNKAGFLSAVHQHILTAFVRRLEETMQTYEESPALLKELGKAYVTFFYLHPRYYDILFSRKHVLSSVEPPNDSAHPLGILKKAAVKTFGAQGLPQRELDNMITALWALVQGLSEIMSLQDAEGKADMMDRLDDIFSSVSNWAKGGQAGEDNHS